MGRNVFQAVHYLLSCPCHFPCDCHPRGLGELRSLPLCQHVTNAKSSTNCSPSWINELQSHNWWYLDGRKLDSSCRCRSLDLGSTWGHILPALLVLQPCPGCSPMMSSKEPSPAAARQGWVPPAVAPVILAWPAPHCTVIFHSLVHLCLPRGSPEGKKMTPFLLCLHI